MGSPAINLALPIPRRLKFLIASITKTFTAAAIIVIERQGWRSFEDPLSKFLQDFPSGDKIKISHLLCTPQEASIERKMEESDSYSGTVNILYRRSVANVPLRAA